MKGPPQTIIYKAWVCLLQGKGRLTSHTPGIRLADLPLSTRDREKNWRETSGFRKGAATVPRPAQVPTGKGPWISNGLNIPSRRRLALSPFADIPYKRAAHRMKVPLFQKAVGWTTCDRSWEDRRDGIKMSHSSEPWREEAPVISSKDLESVDGGRAAMKECLPSCSKSLKPNTWLERRERESFESDMSPALLTGWGWVLTAENS